MPKTASGSSLKAKLREAGFSEKIIDEILKWYECPEEKKGR
jgi:SOS response regulatory protein OraA/RecX